MVVTSEAHIALDFKAIDYMTAALRRPKEEKRSPMNCGETQKKVLFKHDMSIVNDVFFHGIGNNLKVSKVTTSQAQDAV